MKSVYLADIFPADWTGQGSLGGMTESYRQTPANNAAARVSQTEEIVSTSTTLPL